MTATNYGPISSFDEELAPLSVFASKNGTGKTYMHDLPSLCLFGDAGRVEQKKHMHMLVKRGAATSRVSIVTGDGEVIERDVASGKALGELPQLPAALPYCLKAGAFASLSPQDRRGFLYSLMGLSQGPEEIVKRLLARGIDKALVERVTPLLAGGFTPALSEAERRRQEAKGAWHEVTGEQWGSKKAPSWVAVAPEFDAAALTEVAGYVKGWKEEVEYQNRLVGEHASWKRQQDQLPDLKAKGLTHGPASERLNAARKRHGDITRELEAIPEPGAQPAPQGSLPGLGDASGSAPARDSTTHVMQCPDCKVELVYKLGKLVHAPKAAEPTPAPAKAKAAAKEAPAAAVADPHKDRRAQLKRDQMEQSSLISAAERDMRAADEALALASQIEATAFPEGAAEAAEALDKARSELAICETEETALRDKQRQAKEAQAKTTRASDLHLQVLRWDALCNALAPDGLPAEILRDALGPLAAQLQAAHEVTGWPLVEVQPDMTITMDGFPHMLLSKSHRWRCNAMLVVAFAILSGVRLVLLDEFDLLNPKSLGGDREMALGWLYDLTVSGELEQAILFGTMPAMDEMPDGAACFWLGEAA